jgi:hypothetical protein
MRVQGFCGSGSEPRLDIVADLRLRRWQRAQRLDCALDRSGTPLPFV